jgi:hypothetical protein
MSRIISKKRALLGIVASLAIAAVAIAYWTTAGSGTGTGGTQDETDIVDLTVAQDTVLTEMYPGDSPQTITVTVSNSNDASIRVASVTASKTSVTGAAGSCDVSDYTLTDNVMSPAQEIVGDGTAQFTGADVQFNNKATNQDGCKGATLNLTYTVNGS